MLAIYSSYFDLAGNLTLMFSSHIYAKLTFVDHLLRAKDVKRTW